MNLQEGGKTMTKKFKECKEIIAEALKRLEEAGDGEFEVPEITDELVYSIFGENLDVENSVEEVMWMFMMEL